MLPLFLLLYGEKDEYAAPLYTASSSSRYDAGYSVDLPILLYGSDDYGSTGSGADTGLSAAYTLDAETGRYSTGTEYDRDNYNGLALGVPAYDEFYDVLS